MVIHEEQKLGNCGCSVDEQKRILGGQNSPKLQKYK